MQDNLTYSLCDPQNKKQRIWELDFIRGFLIFLMLIDHFVFAMYDIVPSFFSSFAIEKTWLNYVIKFGDYYWNANWRIVIRQISLFGFFTVCGVCTHFSKSNFKRGCQLLFLGLFISIFSIILSNESLYGFLESFNLGTFFVVYSLFTCYGVCLLMYELFKFIYFLFFKNEYYFSFVCLFFSMLIIFLCVYFKIDFYDNNLVYYEYVSFFDGFFMLKVPSSQMDYFPIIPYIIYVFLGAFIGGALYKDRKSLIIKKDNYFSKKFSKPILFIGHYSIFFYLFQQVPFIIFWYLVYYFTLKGI